VCWAHIDVHDATTSLIGAFGHVVQDNKISGADIFPGKRR
jgi:hypothetical protein